MAVLEKPDINTVIDLLDARARDTPDAPAVSFPAGQATYAEVAAASRVAARQLYAGGVAPGDRVGILLREASLAFVTIGLGILRLGAICVPINARSKSHELGYVIGHSGLSLIFTEAMFEPLLADAHYGQRVRIVRTGDRGFTETASSADPAELDAIESTVSAHTPSLLLYTSGTTASPKGCLHTHATMLASGRNTASRLELTPADRYWTALAMFHVGGWQVLMANLSAGSCFSHPGVVEPTRTLDQLERERVTVAMPAFELIWLGVLGHERFPDADLSALRTVMNVGVPERMAQMQAMVPQAVQISMIGMTECFGSICIGAQDDSEQSRTHTCGRPLPGMEVMIIDPDGEPCPPDCPGELLFRGVSRFAEYYRDPAATAATIDTDGWVHTGDLAVQDADGCVAFVSRLKDMLKVGGENASAAEIEGFLITHPAVATAAVVAAPDARYGEVAAAFVQIVPGAAVTESELVAFCTGRIASFKVPRYIRFVDEYPVTASAKIQKYVLREQIRAELLASAQTEAPRIASRR